MAPHPETTVLPSFDLTIENVTREGAKLELDRREVHLILAAVSAIRHTLKMGNLKICTALAVPKITAGAPMIKPMHLKQVLDDDDLLTEVGSYAPRSMSAESIAACRAFIDGLTEELAPPDLPVIPLVYVTVSDFCMKSDLDAAMVGAVTQLARAIGVTLAQPHHDAFQQMRAELPDPPEMDPQSGNILVTSTMLAAVLESWHMWQQLLDERPELVNHATIQQGRKFIEALTAS